MAKVVDLENARWARSISFDLTALAKNAAIIKGKMVNFRNDLKRRLIVTASPGEFKMFLSGLFSEAIFKHPSLISRESLLCGIYFAQVLTQFLFEKPKSWWAIDYLLEHAEATAKNKRTNALKCGGDLCFLVCAVYPERANIRAMTLRDYQAMGIGLFQRHHTVSGVEISYYMSKQFSNMANIVYGHILPELQGVR